VKKSTFHVSRIAKILWQRKSRHHQLPDSGGSGESAPGRPGLGQHGVNIMGFCKEFHAADQG